MSSKTSDSKSETAVSREARSATVTSIRPVLSQEHVDSLLEVAGFDSKIREPDTEALGANNVKNPQTMSGKLGNLFVGVSTVCLLVVTLLLSVFGYETAGSVLRYSPSYIEELSSEPWRVGVAGILTAHGSCSGAVVGDRWVITAAHCLSEQAPGKVRVTLGFGLFDGTSVFSTVADSLIIHPKFTYSTSNTHDLALIHTSETLPKNWTRLGLSKGWTAPYGWHLLFGYGWFMNEDGVPVQGLLKGMLLSSYYTPFSPTITSVRLTSPQPCFGDSGGPLLNIRDGRPSLIGVVSTIVRSSPSVCSNVVTSSLLDANALRWIRDAVARGNQNAQDHSKQSQKISTEHTKE